jgi:hypothetical protein
LKFNIQDASLGQIAPSFRSKPTVQLWVQFGGLVVNDPSKFTHNHIVHAPHMIRKSKDCMPIKIGYASIFEWAEESRSII